MLLACTWGSYQPCPHDWSHEMFPLLPLCLVSSQHLYMFLLSVLFAAYSKISPKYKYAYKLLMQSRCFEEGDCRTDIQLSRVFEFRPIKNMVWNLFQVPIHKQVQIWNLIQVLINKWIWFRIHTGSDPWTLDPARGCAFFRCSY